MEAGIYTAQVVEHAIRQSPIQGTWYIDVLFKLVGSDEIINGHVWLTEKSMGIARKSLKAMGFDIDTFDLSHLQENHTLLAGNKCKIDIQLDDQGKELRVKWINPLGDTPSKQVFDNLTQQLRTVKKANGPDGKPKPPASKKTLKEAIGEAKGTPQKPQPPQEGSDEDVPF